MSGYVRPNIVIKALQELCQTLLYKSAKFSIRPNWQDLVELTNINETIKSEKTLVQNILSLEHVIDNTDKSIIIALGQGSQLFGLFHDAHFEEYNFSTLFYAHQDHPLHVPIKKLCKQN